MTAPAGSRTVALDVAGRYWAEIDGLRAVAVLSVVLFHAGVPGLGGGYVGVDVFFVISGFLITGLLAREIETTGRLDIVEFYARRVRRLLPALAVVLAATLAGGAVWLTPAGEQQGLASSAWATAAFLSNIYFWQTQTGYFAGPSEQLPLLHMWTLAVEEQFYIVWPLAMLLVARLARYAGWQVGSALTAALVAGSAISLLACVLVTPARTTWAFYLTPFRAWEFGAGGLVALLGMSGAFGRLPRWAGVASGGLGLAAIAASVCLYDMATLFPGWAALVPVAGTAAVIGGIVVAPASPVAAILGTPLLVLIGRLSYSWYLWHWPLLAMARAASLGEHSLGRDLALVLAALVLSALTYWVIEEPVRRRQPWPFRGRGTTVAAGLALLAGTAVAAAGLRISGDAALAASEPMRAAALAKQQTFPFPSRCSQFQLPYPGLTPVEGCTVGAPSPLRIVLWGDSHAFHLVPTVAAYGEGAGVAVLPRAMGACKPHVASSSGTRLPHAAMVEACIAFNRDALGDMPRLAQSGAKVVVLAARWSVPSVWQVGLGAWQDALAATVERIRAADLAVLIVADVPGYPYSVPECVIRRGADACSLSRSEVEAERAATVTALNRIAARLDRVAVWDPVESICDADRCSPVRDGLVTTSDDQHLSVAAARRLKDSFGRALADLLKTHSVSGQ